MSHARIPPTHGHAPPTHPPRPLGVLVLGVAALLGACATRPPPPTLHITEAQAAVDSAVRAGAPAVSPNELAMARDKLGRAQISMQENQHERARMLAEAALVDARLAEARTRQVQATKAAVTVQDDSRVLRQEIDRGAAQ